MWGRPLEFDPADAIEEAMYAFWEVGFAGTSVQELVEATGVPRQSLYNTLGDKRTVYLAALECHLAQESEWLGALRVPEADLDSVEALLQERAAHDEEVAAVLAQHTRIASASFARALRQGFDLGQVRGDLDFTVAARTLTMLLHGIAVASRTGATRRSLLETVMQAVDVLRA